MQVNMLKPFLYSVIGSLIHGPCLITAATPNPFRGDLACDQDSLPELRMCPSPHSRWQGYYKDLQTPTLTAAYHSKRDKKTFVSGWGEA